MNSPPGDGHGLAEAVAQNVRQKIFTLAHEVGFDLVGVAELGAIPRQHEYRQWIASGGYGEMRYLAETMEQRLNPQVAFPWAKCVICLAMSYFQAGPHGRSAGTTGAAEAESAIGRVARYAWGRDYHRVLKARMMKLLRSMQAAVGSDFQAKICVDTAPVHERELAAAAGLGWIGKNTLLVNPRHGSWFVLGEIITDLALPPTQADSDRCGTCTRCIDACPTQAISPYKLDAIKCISYQTLENRGAIPADLHEPMRQAGYVVGCDICQDVCPYNRRPLATREADFSSPEPLFTLPQISNWCEADWDKATRGKAYRRAKLGMWQRNAEVLAGDGA